MPVIDKKLLPVIAACMFLLLTGCVQRKLCIRSEPAGAPVWVDEEYAGLTPTDIEFTHYGNRRLRIGPIRNEDGATLYQSKETIYKTVPPFYQRFPLDFFFEVLWPGTITDKHLYETDLLPAEKPDRADVDRRIREIIQEGTDFREKSGKPPEDF